MKALLLIFFLGICTMLNAGGITNSDPPAGPKVTVSVEIGLIPTCMWAWSICGITLTAGGSSNIMVNEGAAGGGGGGGGAKSWLLTIPREYLSQNYAAHLPNLDGKSHVVFQGDYVLPTEVKQALGVTGDLMVKRQTPYAVKYLNGNYVITFPY